MDLELINLVKHLQKEEMEFFDEFYNLTKKKVFYMCYSIIKDTDDSEDILQDTYIKFLKYKNKVKLDGNILSYLLEIAKNLSLNFIKKQKKFEKLNENIEIEDSTEKKTNYMETELVINMKKILNDFEFQIVILHVVSELTHKTISELLGKPLGTITWSYNNAILKLRRNLDDGKEN